MRPLNFITILLFLAHPASGQKNKFVSNLQEILEKQISYLKTLNVDTILVYSCDTVSMNKKNDSTSKCYSGDNKFKYVIWRQFGKTYLQKVSCYDTTSHAQQIDNNTIDFYYDNKISAKVRKKEFKEFHKKDKPYYHSAIFLPTAKFYSLVLYQKRKTYSTVFTNQDNYWRQVKMFDTEMKWAELIDKCIGDINPNYGM